MEIEKLKDMLRNAAGGPVGIQMCQEAADALEQLQAENDRLKEEVQQMRWIPVEERLPTGQTECIVCVDGNVSTDVWCVYDGGERWLIHNEMFHDLMQNPYDNNPKQQKPPPVVTHWMLLPKPPKESQQ